MILSAGLFALLNHARGSRLFGLTDSTSIGRLVASFGMALIVTFSHIGQAAVLLPVAWGGLLGWMIPGWDWEWHCAITGTLPASGSPFVFTKWLMKIWAPPKPGAWLRIWGTVALGLRMILAAPVLLAIAYLTGGNFWWPLDVPLLALPYLFFGLFKTQYVITFSEYAAGGLLGFIAVKAMGL